MTPLAQLIFAELSPLVQEEAWAANGMRAKLQSMVSKNKVRMAGSRELVAGDMYFPSL